MQNFIENKINFSHYLKDKNIIIVGPSSNLENKKLGKKIDSYDVIIRLNNSFPISLFKESKEDIGSRTDVLYHTGAISKVLELANQRYKIDKAQLLISDKIKYFVAKRDAIKGTDREKKYILDLIKIIRNKIKVVSISKKSLMKVRKSLKNTDPNISTMTIMHLLDFKFKSCRIVGCDFYESDYHKSYFLPDTLKFDKDSKKIIRKDGKKRRKPKIPHDTKIQIRFLLRIFKNDKRFIVDDIKTWKAIINDN